MIAKVPATLIQLNEKGTPCTVNKHVKVHMIAAKHIHGNLSVNQITNYYGINIADVYAALAYYYDNADYYAERESAIQPLIEDAREYTANLKAKIEAHLAEKKSED